MTVAVLTLEAWARQQYGASAPHINTLRRWAAGGNIYPAPRKHGRAWFVSPDAVYVDPLDGTSLAAAIEEQRDARASSVS